MDDKKLDKDKIEMEEKLESKDNRKKAQKLAGKLLITFFSIMLLLSMLSRGADSLTVPVVNVSKASKGTLNYQIEGNGILNAETEKYINLSAGLRVEKVNVKKGQLVTKGQTILTFDSTYLEDSLETAKELLDASRRSYETEALSQKMKTDNVSVAKETIQTTNTALVEALEEYNLAKEKYEKEKNKIEKKLSKEKKEDYENAVQLLGQAEEDYVEAQENLEKVTKDQEEALVLLKENGASELEGLEQELGDAEFSLELLVGDYNKVMQALGNYINGVSGGDFIVIQKNLEELIIAYFGYTEYMYLIEDFKEENEEKYIRILQAANAYESAYNNKESKDLAKLYRLLLEEVTDIYKVDEASKYTLEKRIERLNSRIEETKKKNDKNAIKQEEIKAEQIKLADKKLQVAYDEMLKQEENYEEAMAEVYDNEDEILNANNILKQALVTYENAKKAYADAEAELEKTKKNAGYQDKIDEMRLEELARSVTNNEEKLTNLEAIIEKGGALIAPETGTIMELEVTDMQVTSGTEKISIALGTCYVEGSLNKDNYEYVSEGDTVSCKIGTLKDSVDLIITSIATDIGTGTYTFTAAAEDTKNFTAVLDSNAITPGSSVAFKISNTSEGYEYCIPITGIRSDASGSYVLYIVKKSSILGDEDYAYRMNVEIVDKDYKIAVVDKIPPDIEIITGSSNVIMEGDRVRVK